MQTADNVAKWFLLHNKAFGMGTDVEYLTNLKLQKLLYYAQGCYLALYDKPLFKEPILAWGYSPVVESVYDTYKHNRYDGIKEFEAPVKNFTETEESVLTQTYEAFGQYSAWKLVDMTHNETPWKSTPRGEVIVVDEIRQYFKDHYVEED